MTATAPPASLATTPQPPVESLSFEQAMKELEGIVRRLESGAGALESAIVDYTRGTALERHCRRQLDAAKLKIEKIGKGEDGALKLEPFEAGE